VPRPQAPSRLKPGSTLEQRVLNTKFAFDWNWNRVLEFTQVEWDNSCRERDMPAELRSMVAQCAWAIEATDEPTKHEMLTHLHALWINLAHESPYLSADALAEQIAKISLIHTDIVPRAAGKGLYTATGRASHGRDLRH
jgi:hypothetical protein